ncbi:MAG: L-aspartate oxidase [Chrysiogenetes bacterium]|nr:L-aspartate oxidase [Chrysiogenetes bacterium]
MERETDILVIGSGIAGLFFALRMAEKGRVLIVTKREMTESSTRYAQGGIASVWSDSDNENAHVADTLTAGAGLCHEDTVRLVVHAGPPLVHELIDRWGVSFTKREDGEFDLGREGGHTQRRVLHAEDQTGREIARALLEAARAHPNVEILEHTCAINLITSRELGSRNAVNRCLGAYVLRTESGLVETVRAGSTMIATGGCGKVYLYTSNPDVATGDGIAMGFRAGVPVANMEFIQFHPTCLYHPQAKSFLITEALRGEGAILRTRSGDAFMKRYHDMADLAPRDIVARSIDTEMKRSGADCVFLDATHLGSEFLEERFPHITRTCREFGVDPAVSAIPVVPAAHYCCGGLITDPNGETAVRGLYVTGESAFTGLHGANRLASNSLLEALVYADRAGKHLLEQGRIEEPPHRDFEIPAWDPGRAVDPDEMVVVSHNWDEIRRFMWDYVGIVRSNKRLERARARIQHLLTEIDEYYWDYKVTEPLIELRNLATVASLIIRSAQMRQESRGLHYNADHPETDDAHWHRDTVILP